LGTENDPLLEHATRAGEMGAVIRFGQTVDTDASSAARCMDEFPIAKEHPDMGNAAPSARVSEEDQIALS
jgi:hypothetical protein